MKNYFHAKVALGAAALVALVMTACTRQKAEGWQGYIEGEFVYVAAPLSGRLEKLSVTKGARVAAEAPLFTLERASELAAQHQAADQLAAAQARLADLKKGSRPTELAQIEARLAQARSTAELSKLDLARQENLFKTQVISAADFDRARLTHARNAQAAEELTAQIATAQLGGRTDAIAAAEADVSAATAAKERADWSVKPRPPRGRHWSTTPSIAKANLSRRGCLPCRCCRRKT
jgi:HlyD family secretion protein